MHDSSLLYTQLRTAIAQWVEFPEPLWQELASQFKLKVFQAKESVMLPGTTKHELLFVCKGLLRFYYPDENGVESNKAFIAEHSFAGPLAAHSLNLSLLYGVEALEPTTVLTAQLSDFTNLYEQHPLFDKLGRKLAEQLLVHKELRTRSLLQRNATERYQEFLSHHSHVAQRIPQYHIASYLGITEVSLSRIRKALTTQQAYTCGK